MASSIHRRDNRFLRKCPFMLLLLLLLLLLDTSNEGTSARAFHADALVVPSGPSSRTRLDGPQWSVDKTIHLQASSSSNINSGENNNNNNDNADGNKIRLNKVFKRTHSRREADRLIEAGRVSVNGEPVDTKGGFFVVPYVDEISLDGEIVEGWEEMNYVGAAKETTPNNKSKSKQGTKHSNGPQAMPKPTNQRRKRTTFEYIKYWKPTGVICTTDPTIPGNIIEEIRVHDGYDPPHRVYPVGRLDKDTSGLILLTSDGRLPNAALRKEHKRPKVYEVRVDPPIGPPGSHRANRVLEKLSEGVVISTETVRNGVRKTLTAPTEPCRVEQLNDQWIRMTLREGRNRQVRKMTRAVGHKTVELERVSFAGIPLEPGLRGPGDWDYLTGDELEIVEDMINIAEEARAAESGA